MNDLFPGPRGRSRGAEGALSVRLFSDLEMKSFASVALDFEFSHLPAPAERMDHWLKRVELLSIGLAPSGGVKPLYAAASLSPHRVAACSPWTKENVIPLISARPTDCVWTTEPQLRHQLVDYLLRVESAESRPVVVIADWPGDLMLLHRVLGSMCPRLALASPDQDAVSPWRADGERTREGLIRHNALDDAIWLRRVLGFEQTAHPDSRRVA